LYLDSTPNGSRTRDRVAGLVDPDGRHASRAIVLDASRAGFAGATLGEVSEGAAEHPFDQMVPGLDAECGGESLTSS